MDYVPGQYVQLRCPAYDGNEEVFRAYSIASDPAERNVVELVIRLVPGGICTTWCFENLGEGDEVVINGPYGEFRLSDTEAPIVFIAGGSGIARRKAAFYFGANLVKELCLIEEMRAFEEQLDDFSFVPVVARPAEDEKWGGETGLVTEAVERAFGDLAGHEGYLCGSPGMIDAAVEMLKKLGMSEESIFYDKFE
jgi:Na+-transporting NADH:ubiquinone oxidoreductase subunit F